MRSETNLLVLDEPTNHLDIPSRDVLEDALKTYGGTMIAVSHDRYFLNLMVDRLLVLGNGGWELIEGNYDAWQRQRVEVEDRPVERSPEKASQKAVYERNRADRRAQEGRKRRLQAIEKEILDLEAELERLDDNLRLTTGRRIGSTSSRSRRNASGSRPGSKNALQHGKRWTRRKRRARNGYRTEPVQER